MSSADTPKQKAQRVTVTLRDYFAAEGISEATRLEEVYASGTESPGPTYDGIAARAWAIADAMLKARGQ